MSIALHSRSWHVWLGTLLAVPIFIVAATAVFIAHKQRLGTEDLRVPAGWLPGYRGERLMPPRHEARATLTTTAGETWIGTTGGLYRLDGKRLVAVEALAGVQVRSLAEAGWGSVVAATKNGVWHERKGDWQRLYKGDAWNVTTRPDGSVVIAIKEQGLLTSTDGRDWQPDAPLSAALTTLSIEADVHGETITLGKVIMDLHTGKAFFGKEGEWIWIDLVGIALLLLALTGVYCWWRAERRKAALCAS